MFMVETLTNDQLVNISEQYLQKISSMQNSIMVENDAKVLTYLADKIERLLAKQDAVNAEKAIRGV